MESESHDVDVTNINKVCSFDNKKYEEGITSDNVL